MALQQFGLASLRTTPFIKRVTFDLNPSIKIHRMDQTKISNVRMCNQIIVRRSGNYNPPTWKNEFIQSLTSEFTGEVYIKRLNDLNQEVKVIMGQIIDDPLKQLELIDSLQRLGISYHFENEINSMLKRIYDKSFENDNWKRNNLYATALEFRLLRQHRFNISQEVFNNFKDETKKFSTHLYEDLKGIFCLYEASFLCVEDEKVLEEARDFTKTYLQEYIKFGEDEVEVTIITHALELPLHWTVSRVETRWFIDIYERKTDMNPILLEFAKLDFNKVQSIHQEDLKYASSWWKSNGLAQKLGFSRDVLVESFLWAVGIGFEPELSHFRRTAAKVNILITTIDDIYDIYGTLDELHLFTNAFERWDVDALDQLPHYMKLCFLLVHNSVNEMAYEILLDNEINVIQYLKNSWVDMCKAYMLEAEWYHSGYKPTLKEYLDNAWLSIAGTVILIHAYIFVTIPTLEDMENMKQHVDAIRWSSVILRLADDLGTSTDELERGDVPKSIQCYMNDTGASEIDARKHIWYLIDETWKKMNKVEAENSIFPQTFIERAKNMGRIAQCVYQFGDGHGKGEQVTRERVMSLLIQPISIN